MLSKLTIREEAEQFLALINDEDASKQLWVVYDKLEKQFGVIQTRSQLLLTLGTITLTITGFSGPKIASSGIFAALGMALGLCFVLSSMLCLIFGSLRIQWVTQWRGPTTLDTIESLLHYRDKKTKAYHLEVGLLAIGLTCYVLGIVAYVLVSAS